MIIDRSAHRPAVPRILVVDDEPEICDFVVRALSAAGYAIDFACTGAGGLRLALAGETA